MATRSTIAIEHSDGTVQQVYCHWDGYLDHNGAILRDHWSDPAKLQQLIDLGDLSSLKPELGDKHDFDYYQNREQYTAEQLADFERNWCLFYGRDRGEPNVSARQFTNFNHYATMGQKEEYNYILKNNGLWYVEYYDTCGLFVELARSFEEHSMQEDV